MIDRARFLDALRFLTIIPVPSSVSVQEPDWLSRCVKYFPLVGIIVGLASALVWLLTGGIWGPVIAAILAVATGIVIRSIPLHLSGEATGGNLCPALLPKEDAEDQSAGFGLGRETI